MKIDGITLTSDAVLAPIAGYSDVGFRKVCADMGAGLTYTEMISAKGLAYGSEKTEELLYTTDSEKLKAVQIFGSEPKYIEKACLHPALDKFDVIDINMGCPMPKIVCNNEGSALLENPRLASELVKAAKKAGKPVTVKIRLGVKNGEYVARDFARYMQDAGASAITVHGRTRQQMYSGVADWEEIAKVKEVVEIPLIANGDVFDGNKALACLRRTGADALMVGRASFGDPWVFQEIQAALRGEPVPPRPPLAERVDVALRQFELAMEDKGERIACLEARKHFAWYLRGVSYANYYKEKISNVSSMAEIRAVAEGVKRDLK